MMGKYSTYFGKLMLVSVLLSCAGPIEEQVAATEPSWYMQLESMAELNCRSIALRKERFKLADEIRAHDDSLLRVDAHAFKSDSSQHALRRARQEARKDRLSDQSAALADSIRVKLNASLMHLSPGEKRAFSDSLKNLLDLRGCVD